MTFLGYFDEGDSERATATTSVRGKCRRRTRVSGLCTTAELGQRAAAAAAVRPRGYDRTCRDLTAAPAASPSSSSASAAIDGETVVDEREGRFSSRTRSSTIRHPRTDGTPVYIFCFVVRRCGDGHHDIIRATIISPKPKQVRLEPRVDAPCPLAPIP